MKGVITPNCLTGHELFRLTKGERRTLRRWGWLSARYEKRAIKPVRRRLAAEQRAKR